MVNHGYDRWIDFSFGWIVLWKRILFTFGSVPDPDGRRAVIKTKVGSLILCAANDRKDLEDVFRGSFQSTDKMLLNSAFIAFIGMLWLGQAQNGLLESQAPNTEDEMCELRQGVIPMFLNYFCQYVGTQVGFSFKENVFHITYSWQGFVFVS